MPAYLRVSAVSVLGLALCASTALAGGGPENVMVVVNADSWASVALANEFIDLRHVPPSNVVYLRLATRYDPVSIDIDSFRTEILKPILSAITSRGLSSQIDYIVYSSDFPYTVVFSGDLAGVKPPPAITPNASITSMTYLYSRVLAKDPRYLSLDANKYARAAVSDPKTTALARLMQSVQTLVMEQKYEAAEALNLKAVSLRPDDPRLYYSHACILALLKRNDDAMAELSQAVDKGWNQPDQTMATPMFKDFQGREDFKELLARMRTTQAPASA